MANHKSRYKRSNSLGNARERRIRLKEWNKIIPEPIKVGVGKRLMYADEAVESISANRSIGFFKLMISSESLEGKVEHIESSSSNQPLGGEYESVKLHFSTNELNRVWRTVILDRDTNVTI